MQIAKIANYIATNQQFQVCILFLLVWVIWGILVFFIYHRRDRIFSSSGWTIWYLIREFMAFAGMGPLSTAIPFLADDETHIPK
jgi:hypothetical protein